MDMFNSAEQAGVGSVPDALAFGAGFASGCLAGKPKTEAFGDDEIYFGSVKVHLAPVAGSVLASDLL